MCECTLLSLKTILMIRCFSFSRRTPGVHREGKCVVSAAWPTSFPEFLNLQAMRQALLASVFEPSARRLPLSMLELHTTLTVHRRCPAAWLVARSVLILLWTEA